MENLAINGNLAITGNLTMPTIKPDRTEQPTPSNEWAKENWMYIDVKDNARVIWDAAQLAERESCAKTCECAHKVGGEIHDCKKCGGSMKNGKARQ